MNTETKQTMNPETGTRYSRAELKTAFDAVCDKANWKMAIDAEIEASAAAAEITRDAVIFFAGCEPSFSQGTGNRLRVQAVGYYAAVGA